MFVLVGLHVCRNPVLASGLSEHNICWCGPSVYVSGEGGGV